MKKFLFLSCAISLVCAGCGDEPKENPTEILLSKTEVILNVGEDVNIDVSGVNIDDCIVSSDDEFIAYATVSGGKINIEAEHAGETVVFVKAGNDVEECKVKITPMTDYVGSVVTEWGISYEELKEKVEKPYDSFMDDTQRGSKNFTYRKSGYKITNRYYFENGMLCGVEKIIQGTGSDADVFLNISNSLFDYAEYEESYHETINQYPKANVSGYIYSYPQKYYAVYEQTIYDMLWESGTQPSTKNIIYFAKDLDAAKEHTFTWLN